MCARNIVFDGDLHTSEYFFLDHVCRLCWGADAIVELTSTCPKPGENTSTYAEKIQECTGIDITSHSHPKKLCLKCTSKIEMFTEFKLFCQENDRKLHYILKKGTQYQNIDSAEAENELKSDLVFKQEPDVDFTNIDLDESIKDFFDDLPSPIEVKKLEKPVRRKRRIKQANYCNFCRMNLETAEHLTQHNLEYHGIEGKGVFKCFGCEKRFNDVKKRLRHETDTCQSLKNGYKCGVCGRYLPKRRIYENHIKAHKNNEEVELPDDIYKCRKCMKLFENAEGLGEHRLSCCHKEKKSYVCDTCGRVFSRRDYLYKHKLVHEGSKLQKCPHCDYRAVQKTSLTVHIRKHTGERPYACDMCPHRCVTSSNLRAHRKRHLGVKAFECKLCDKKFGYKMSLEEHTASVHSQPESHACSACGAVYSRFRGLRRHLLAKHGKKVRKLKDDLVEIENGTKVNGENDRNEILNKDLQNNKLKQSLGLNELCLQKLDGSIEIQTSQSKITGVEIQSFDANSKSEILDKKNVGAVQATDGALYLTSTIIM